MLTCKAYPTEGGTYFQLSNKLQKPLFMPLIQNDFQITRIIMTFICKHKCSSITELQSMGEVINF